MQHDHGKDGQHHRDGEHDGQDLPGVIKGDLGVGSGIDVRIVVVFVRDLDKAFDRVVSCNLWKTGFFEWTKRKEENLR